MKNYKFLFSLWLVVIFAFVQMGFAQKTSRCAVKNADAFARVELSRVRLRPCAETPKQCALNILSASDDAVSETPTSVEIFDFGKNKIVVLAMYKVDEDDSLAGTRYRVEFNKNAGKYEFVQLGKQFKCARGRTSWSKELCP
ncbi:MAG: hypothetical protein H0W58_01245 [Acidobacteria bacterium]|jgi:hypothetical protein|nr:hypothetical protein [Acidobacteriota bacterium]